MSVIVEICCYLDYAQSTAQKSELGAKQTHHSSLPERIDNLFVTHLNWFSLSKKKQKKHKFISFVTRRTQSWI